MDLQSKENFQFLYIVNFNCKKNSYESLKGDNSFYIVENSIIDMPNFYTKLKGITKNKKFYYFSEKTYNNPNKEFEFFVEKLKKDFNIEQDAYLVKAIRKK